MNRLRIQAPAGNPYLPRQHGDVSGMFEFMPDFMTADGALISDEPMECRCRYLVNIVRVSFFAHWHSEPPPKDEIKELGDFEMRVRVRNPDYPAVEGATRYTSQWVPIPADLMVYVQRWMDSGNSFDEGIFEEAREAMQCDADTAAEHREQELRDREITA